MRQIKFRVYDIVDKEMTNFESIRFLPNETMLHEIFQEERYKWMQFTGLTDKNGVEIYEGDVVEASMPRDFEKTNKYIVGFYNGSFCFYRSTEDRYPCVQWKDGSNDWTSIENVETYLCEILGDIYQNPELLK